MKTLVIYTTTHGCTGKVVTELQEKIEGEITVINLRKEEAPLLTDYNQIIIGGSIHAGQIQKRIKEFCQKNLDILLKRDVGLFICCMEEGAKAQEQMNNAFPEELMQHAKSTAVMGGEFNFDRMNFLEKLVVKKVAHVKEPVSKINHASIDKFATDMQKIFNPFLFLA